MRYTVQIVVTETLTFNVHATNSEAAGEVAMNMLLAGEQPADIAQQTRLGSIEEADTNRPREE